jgi:hypothetical protein
MEASRTHEVTRGQSIWSWVVIGAVGLALTVTIAVWNGTSTDNVVVRAPADAEAQIGPPTKDFALHGRGAPDARVNVTANPGFLGTVTGIREGGAYAGAIPLGTPTSFADVRESGVYAAIPVGTPDSFADVRESGAYYGGQDVTATPRHGRCPSKHGC